VLETASLSWPELTRRTWREVIDDDVLGLAAQLSYYFFLALFPALLFLLAVASFFPLSNITDDIGRTLGPCRRCIVEQFRGARVDRRRSQPRLRHR
jgi:hypothetical protein